MIVVAQVGIEGSKAAVWAAISDIANAAQTFSGIERIDMLETPASGLVGLKWRETRILFDKPASVDKWITEAVENEFYTTRAEMDGFVFLTTKRIADSGDGVSLSEAHESVPQSLLAKLKIPMLFLFKGVIKKALMQDLNDVKAKVEQK